MFYANAAGSLFQKKCIAVFSNQSKNNKIINSKTNGLFKNTIFKANKCFFCLEIFCFISCNYAFCRFCCSQEILSFFCKNCLRNPSNTETYSFKNTCGNCVECPICKYILTIFVCPESQYGGVLIE